MESEISSDLSLGCLWEGDDGALELMQQNLLCISELRTTAAELLR